MHSADTFIQSSFQLLFRHFISGHQINDLDVASAMPYQLRYRKAFILGSLTICHQSILGHLSMLTKGP